MSQSGDDRRPTKAVRREQARVEREEIQRKQAARARRRTTALVVLGVVVVVAVVAIVVVPKLSKSDTTTVTGPPATPDALLAQAADAKKTAGCTDVTNVGYYGGVSDKSSPNYLDQTHIGGASMPQIPPLSTYPSIPPASGPHDPNPLAAGVYDKPPDLARAIHSLEHGGTIVWYDPSAPQAAIDEIKAFYAQQPSVVSAGQDRVIVAPFSYPDLGVTGLPNGEQMALVSWHNIQTCATPSLAVALDFTSQYSTPVQGQPAILGRTYLGEAPEPGGQM